LLINHIKVLTGVCCFLLNVGKYQARICGLTVDRNFSSRHDFVSLVVPAFFDHEEII